MTFQLTHSKHNVNITLLILNGYTLIHLLRTTHNPSFSNYYCPKIYFKANNFKK